MNCIKKTLVLQLLLLLCCGFVLGQKYIPNEVYKTTWAYSSLKGKVKTVTSKFYNNIERDSIKNILRKYNSDTLENSCFVTSIIETNFSAIGFKEQEINQQFFIKNYKSESPNFEEVDDDNLSFIPKIKFTKNDTSNVGYKLYRSSKYFKYDSFNRLIEIKNLGSKDEYDYGADFSYDIKGNLVASKFWGENNRLDAAYENKSDIEMFPTF